MVEGVAVTLAPVVADRPVLGVQVYVEAPEADKEVPLPEQTEVAPAINIDGALVTVML